MPLYYLKSVSCAKNVEYSNKKQWLPHNIDIREAFLNIRLLKRKTHKKQFKLKVYGEIKEFDALMLAPLSSTVSGGSVGAKFITVNFSLSVW